MGEIPNIIGECKCLTYLLLPKIRSYLLELLVIYLKMLKFDLLLVCT